ncbi:hypothetical protein P879_03774 [Paragonimus westermani]|uniref:Metal transporter CNNM n=1 Tax=Paragonimus westermani TaxID=34504 RepID=A0A8T0DW95_9TREM|nr:hypothetical protein P879_03774 [Paragonimus westermani]
MKPRISIIFSWLWILHVSSTSSIKPTVYGLLPESYSSISDNIVVIQSNQPVLMTMFGLELDQITHIGFATVKKPSNSPCEHERVTGSFKVVPENANIATSVITLRELSRNEDAFYLCVRTSSSINGLLTSTDIAENNSTDTSEVWFFTGTESSDERISLRTTSTLMPMWVQVILIIILFFLSGLFSGLNLGLMSLDKTELKIIESAGAPSEKTYAKAIRPVREKGNLLLCTLLLGNVLVNTSLTILMDNLTGSGLYAVIGSTIGITLFGEIMPQAVCSRHGLAIGARTLWLTKLFMLITFPVAFPVSFVLDKILGEEMGQVYSREKLGVLIREQNVAGTVATDEMNIITGALALTTKTVADVMTPLSDAFMLSYSDVLDFHTMLNIYSHGYTRIPVYEGDRRNIRSVLNVKDLAFINTEDKVTVSTVCDFYNRSIIVVLDNTNLEAMLKEFRQGRTHMAFVERLVTDGEGDPYRETIGLVTLEDVIEEIIQAEIVDELSPQLKIAALRHLASNVESFHERYMCYSVLQSFLNANIVGRAHVQIGNEGLLFEAGPFVMFGEIVLKRVNAMFPELSEKADPAMCSARLASEARFVPDYLLKAVTNLQYLRITPEHYLVARRLSAVIVRLANSSKSKLSSSQTDTSSLLIPKLHQLPGLGPVKINSHDMFQNAWDHHVVRLREASVAAAVASTIGEQHNDTMNAHSDDGFSVACQSSSPPVPSPPQDRAPNSIRIVRPYNCATPSPNSDDSTIHKRNSLFIPHSGDVLASRPDEIQAFVSHTNELTNSDSDPTRPFRSKARAVRT